MTRARKHIHITLLQAVIALLSPSFLLSSCSSSDDGMSEPNPQNEKQEIRFNPDVWNFMEGTRATTFDGGTLTSGSFKCTAYTANTTIANGVVGIDDNTVTWNGAGWDFEGGKRYWPMDALHLDFFAYMPTTIPAYITNTSDVARSLTYATRDPQFKCSNLPMTAAGQSSITEFVYALVTDEYKGKSPSGITLNFQHPFTKIYLKWANYNHAAISNLTVKLQGIKNNGTYSGGSWSTTEAATDFTTTTLDENAATPTAFLMIPQNWAGDIEVVADWVDWGDTFSHTIKKQVATNWQAGYSYTYTFTITPSELIVVTDKFTEQW